MVSEQTAQEPDSEKKKFNLDEFIYNFRIPLTLLLIGLILIAFGVVYIKNTSLGQSAEVEVLEATTQSEEGLSEIVVEIAGAVEKPGVYTLGENARVEDLLIAAGGLSADADRLWVDRSVNRAAKLLDGQKLYIPTLNEQSEVSGAKNSGGEERGFITRGSGGDALVNINSASQSQLEGLSGIGPVYGSNIIEHRPYSSVEELVLKGAIPKHVYEKIKDKVSVY